MEMFMVSPHYILTLVEDHVQKNHHCDAGWPQSIQAKNLKTREWNMREGERADNKERERERRSDS